MPALGLAQETGKVRRWLRAEGDGLVKGEPLLEVGTDKVTVEIEAPAGGTLTGVSAAEGAEVPVGTVLALIDWEMATLGDPLADLGLHLVYSDPAFDPVIRGRAASTSERLPPTDDLAQRYAVASRRDLGNLAFYLGLGYFKIAVIAEGIHARYAHGFTVGSGFETVGQAVPLLAAAGVNAVAGHP